MARPWSALFVSRSERAEGPHSVIERELARTHYQGEAKLGDGSLTPVSSRSVQ
jgi:hypothetical protein